MQFLSKDISTDFKPWQSSMSRFLGKELRKFVIMIELWTNAAGTADSVFSAAAQIAAKTDRLDCHPLSARL
jgi:hypothetical protein